MRRMKTLVGQCTGPVVLTRLTAKDQADETAAFDAALVTSSMMEGLKACATKVLDLEVETDTPAGLFFGPMEKPFLRPHMGTAAHQKTADALTPVLKHLLS